MRFFRQCLLFLCAGALASVVSTPSATAFTVSSDEDYFITTDGNYSFIYSENESLFIEPLIRQNRAFKRLYESEFQWQLDDPPYLILASPRNQITNGFATIFPSVFTVFYDGGAAAVDDFAASSWLFTLLSHETAHLYQANVKKGQYSRWIKAALGNAAPSFVPPFPYMINPNLFTPTFMLEGNAVFNESRFGNGGRLYNGTYRALLLQLVAAGKVTPKILINETLYWPYGQEKYVVGGYLNLFLAQRFGIDATNAFFMNHSDHFINPFQLDKAFLETFGVGYEKVFADFNKFYSPAAKQMQSAQGSTVAQSKIHGGFNRSGAKIMFFTSDLKTRPRLVELEASGKSESRKLNIPFGKPFNVGGEVFVASSQMVSANEIRYGLYGEGMSPLPQFQNKYVYAMQDNRTAYADIPSSFDTVQLYLDGKFVDSVQSSAVFSPKGDLIYFKQNGDRREMYVLAAGGGGRGDRYKVAEYSGYFGKLVESLSPSDIYFIASTEVGSSLFRVRNVLSGNKAVIERVLAADTVADAIQVSHDQWLVAEVTAEGYNYKIVSLDKPEATPPAYYKYFFDQHETQKFYAGSAEHSTPTKPVDRAPYSSTRAIKFDAIDPLAIGYAGEDFVAGLMARFSDPMQYQQIIFTYLYDIGATNNVMLDYLNRKYLVNFDFGATFEQDAVFTDSTQETVEERFNSYSGTLGAQYPLYQRSQHGAELRTRYTYTYEDTDPLYDDFIERQHSLLTEITWQRTLGYNLAYDASSHQEFLIGHEILRDAEHFAEQNVRYVAQANLSEDLFWENFVSAGYHAVWSEAKSGDIEIKDTLPGLELEPSTTVLRYSPDTSARYVQVNKVSGGYKKAINLGMYFQSFPISLRRFAPFGTYQEFYGARDRGDKLETLFHEWSYGVELELLLFHKFPMRFVANKVEMNKREGSTFSALLTFDRQF